MVSLTGSGEKDQQDIVHSTGDVFSVLMQNKIIPDKKAWKKVVIEENPEGIYVFPFSVMPDRLTESPLFQEIAYYAIFYATEEQQRDSVPKIFRMETLLGNAQNLKNTDSLEDYDPNGFAESVQYEQIKRARGEAYAQPGMTEEQYLERLQKMKLAGDLTLSVYEGTVSLTIKRNVDRKNDKWQGVLDEDLVVISIYLPTESEIFKGLHDWVNKNGLPALFPGE